MSDSHRVAFSCDGRPVDVEVAPGETLLSVLRERLGIVSVKDGCAPQGQCGCCTVLIDGAPRVACVTPAARVGGRAVTTIEGLDPAARSLLADAFVAAGGSQCGFCTPGIIVRAAALLEGGRTSRTDVDRALAAHLCRCTGWHTVFAAVERAATRMPLPAPSAGRDLDAAARRARLEGGGQQAVGPRVPLGVGGFADDGPPTGALVAVPCPPGSGAEHVEAAGLAWVVGESLLEARTRAGKTQGRRSTVDAGPPLPLPECPQGGVRLATGWVEPAYLEPDASWCEPGGDPATPLANGGAFGGKTASSAPTAARELADRLGRSVRVCFSREDVVRLGPKRPPIAASAVVDGRTVRIDGCVAGVVGPFESDQSWPYDLSEVASWVGVAVPGPPTSSDLRAVGLAERAVLIEGAIDEAGASRRALVTDDRVGHVLLDTVAPARSGALAGARVTIAAGIGAVESIEVRVAGGDPLDEVVLRSYCIGAAHMALGWTLSEGIAVDPDTGEVLDLTIRSFGVIAAKRTPEITVTIVDDPGAPLARASDAVFAAVAAATWNAVSAADGIRPESFPARTTRAATALRR
jgi:xanthine dehydrogenase small subunit